MALSKGCTIAIIVVLVVIVLLVIGLIFLGPKLLQKGVEVLIDNTETEILANIPDEYTPDMVHQIMSDLKAAVKNGDLTGPQIQDLANTLQGAMSDQKLEKEEARELLVKIQKALGQEPPEYEEPSEEQMPDSLEAVPDSV